jgi:putative tryptophan/tyrosine transport system substrate-binding protein
MRRREFIAGLAGAAASPLALPAQQLRRIGALLGGEESDPVAQERVDAFRQKLEQLGWLEGRSAHVDWRWAANDREKARAYAAELVGLHPEVIFCSNTIAITDLKQATTTIPIVFASVTEPVANGFVSSLSHPGGNITGFSDRDPSIGGKLSELIKAITPGLERIAIIFNPAINAGRLPQIVYTAATALGIQPILTPVADVRGLEEAIASFARQPGGGLVVPADIFTETHQRLIVELAARHKLPAIYAFRSNVLAGGLASYGVDQFAQYAGAAGYVDRILKGAKASDLPVQQPLKYEFIINARTANALGLTIPETLLATADEVIN